MPAPVAADTRNTRTIRSSSIVERRRLGLQVDLVQDDDLRPLVEPGAVRGELRIDRPPALVRVAFGRIDHVQQQSRAFEMRKKLVPEPDALARALDQARDVGDDELPTVGRLDSSEHGRERRERIVGNLRPRIRETCDERRLACVRQADERGVGEQLQPQLDHALLAGPTDLGEARRLPRRAGEALVPTAAARRPSRRRRAHRDARGRRRAALRRRSTCVPTGT